MKQQSPYVNKYTATSSQSLMNALRELEKDGKFIGDEEYKTNIYNSIANGNPIQHNIGEFLVNSLRRNDRKNKFGQIDVGTDKLYAEMIGEYAAKRGNNIGTPVHDYDHFITDNPDRFPESTKTLGYHHGTNSLNPASNPRLNFQSPQEGYDDDYISRINLNPRAKGKMDLLSLLIHEMTHAADFEGNKKIFDGDKAKFYRSNIDYDYRSSYDIHAYFNNKYPKKTWDALNDTPEERIFSNNIGDIINAPEYKHNNNATEIPSHSIQNLHQPWNPIWKYSYNPNVHNVIESKFRKENNRARKVLRRTLKDTWMNWNEQGFNHPLYEVAQNALKDKIQFLRSTQGKNKAPWTPDNYTKSNFVTNLFGKSKWTEQMYKNGYIDKNQQTSWKNQPQYGYQDLANKYEQDKLDKNGYIAVKMDDTLSKVTLMNELNKLNPKMWEPKIQSGNPDMLSIDLNAYKQRYQHN